MASGGSFMCCLYDVIIMRINSSWVIFFFALLCTSHWSERNCSLVSGDMVTGVTYLRGILILLPLVLWFCPAALCTVPCNTV